MAQDFAGAVSAWVNKTKARQVAVFRESSQRLVEEMQTPISSGGSLPVKSGFLRASLRATLQEPEISVTFNPNNAGSYSYDGSSVAAVIANAKVTDTISAVYTANYATFVHYGVHGHQGRQWVTLAAQRWSQIVAAVAREAEASAS